MNNRTILKKYLTDVLISTHGLSAEVLNNITISYPPSEEHGDYATNAPLFLAKILGKNPLAVAEEIKANFPKIDLISEMTVAKPGFLNFKLSTATIQKTVSDILTAGQRYSEIKPEQPLKIQVEFVSANPTGPLHIGNFRGGPLGDSLARVLTKAGHQVQREYYHNDVGNQVRKLGESILWWVRKASDEDPGEFPEGGYQGDYVRNLSQKSVGAIHESPATAEELGKWAVDYFRDEALKICAKTGIKFDKVVAESEVRDSGWTKKALDVLASKEMLKEKNGATWFAPSDSFLEDRECVVIKSDGQYDYFSNDIGYHANKFDRGFDHVINVWGANHHGHIARMKAALDALGIDPNRLDVILYQWVTLLRNGEKLSMSKRAGTFVTTEEVLNEVGSDALRFTFLTRDASTPLEFDVDLVKRQARENPVYYVQYAHARMCSILSKTTNVGAIHESPATDRLTAPEEFRLLKHLSRFPELIEDIARTYAVHQLTNYAVTLADLFHKFYEQCPVLPNRDKNVTEEISQARVALVTATRLVLAETLDLLGLSAPEKM